MNQDTQPVQSACPAGYGFDPNLNERLEKIAQGCNWRPSGGHNKI